VAGPLAAPGLTVQRSEILELLHLLADRLEQEGLRGEMYVVGGAAIALTFDARRSTRDVDAVFEPKRAIYDAAADIARERGLAEGWLNAAAKGFLSAQDEGATPVLDLPGLGVATASPRIILAMKVLAHRAGEDDADVLLLANELGLTTAADVLAVAADVYGDRLDAAAQFFVQELFADQG
jgi:hypothetical protein